MHCEKHARGGSGDDYNWLRHEAHKKDRHFAERNRRIGMLWWRRIDQVQQPSRLIPLHDDGSVSSSQSRVGR